MDKKTYEQMRESAQTKLWRDTAERGLEPFKKAIFTGYDPETGQGFTPDQNLTIMPSDCRFILDFGCGVGRNAQMLRHVCPFVIGYDLPEAVAKMPQQEAECYTVLTSDWPMLCALAPSNCLIYASLVLQHIEEVYLRDYLHDFHQMSEHLYVVSRWYLDDNHKPILPILLDWFMPVERESLSELLKPKPAGDQTHFAMLLKRRA